MKCKHHPGHTGIGVCGACLHNRLLPLISPDKHSPNGTQDCSPSLPPLSPSSQSAGILFPQSVSPYLPVPLRKTNLHFFHTPQAVPAATGSTEEEPHRVKRKFFFLYSLFGRSSEDKMKSNSSSSWLMHRLMWRGRRKCHVDSVEPTRRYSTRAAMRTVSSSSWK